MTDLPATLAAWDSAALESVFAAELQALPAGALPLEQAVSQSSYLDDSALTVSLLKTERVGDELRLRAGVFFTEIVASCGCGDEPVQQSAYCTLQVAIDAASGRARFEVMD